MSEQRLGRGLKFLLSPGASQKESGSLEIEISSVLPNRFQPRKNFDPRPLADLATSIKEKGVIQPIIVRRLSDGRHELIAGERRLRAATEAGLKKIPAIVRESVSDRESLELAIIENIQREDLDPIEKAKSYKQLADLFGLTQEEIASRVGQDRSNISNYIRLLDLPGEVQGMVSRGTLSMGHARALLGAASADMQLRLAKRIEVGGLSVRSSEDLVSQSKDMLGISRGRRAPGPKSRPAWLVDLEGRIRSRISAKVRIERRAMGAGKIWIEFATDADLERIAKAISSDGGATTPRRGFEGS